MFTRRSLIVVAGVSAVVLIGIFARPVAAQRGIVLYTSALTSAGVNNYLACSANNVASTLTNHYRGADTPRFRKCAGDFFASGPTGVRH